jgi:superfamily II DNA helicase RecQ
MPDGSPRSFDTLLSQVFGFSGFRPGQREIVQAVAEGRDTLAIMPTGGGKSLCFQLPALYREGVTVVVSPLIALMRDQVRALREAGVAAGALTSGNTDEETGRCSPRSMRANSSCFTWRPNGWPRAAHRRCCGASASA